MEEKRRLIQQLDQARETMRAVLAEVDTQMEIYPNWTIKQVLAHITGWDEATCSSLRAHARGEEPAVPAALGIDLYNAQSVAACEALNYEQISEEWELAREDLKAAIEEMPDELFNEPLLLPWGQTGTIEQVVAIFADHEEEHTREIREMKAK